ncbi:Qat anti-phage system QueC-like protein QatC [Acinetobacter towneri]|uniref:Qat anti-phage system QueC-like protein QatC n=1 Tax=Acinetobacter towneri TaxID=202956 RepID=UPI00257583FD|nr:Qat anti-phage system QueC-like protein QatC [Acinetobacter towneri]MDM1742694.1 7-cyano-7-deazaguanine synthase [Acinetobacter towneri]
MKVVCKDKCDHHAQLENNAYYFSFFENSGNPNIGTIGLELLKNFKKKGVTPSSLVFDFLRIGLAINAADQVCDRSHSPDGWTRQIDLEVSLCNPEKWEDTKEDLIKLLKKLTGDFWRLSFIQSNKEFKWDTPHPSKLKPYENATCVSLLSGGMDSLIGGIDLYEKGEKPLFISQVVKGDRQKQIQYAKALKSTDRHFQWSHATKLRSRGERSSRARSIVFYSFALIASELLKSTKTKKIVVPENGFISLNIPLNLGRFGSLSTKTTHPIVLESLENIWKSVGLDVQLVNPYQFMTKGEMIKNCNNQKLLKRYLSTTTSCSRYLTYGYKHCGRCVPCLVRRAAFLASGFPDKTKEYAVKKIAKGGIEKDANDISAVAMACIMRDKKGVKYFRGALAFADAENYSRYEKVVDTGIFELQALLQQHKVIS